MSNSRPLYSVVVVAAVATAPPGTAVVILVPALEVSRNV